MTFTKLVTLLCFLAPTISAVHYCEMDKLPPGLPIMAMGVDISRLDMFPEGDRSRQLNGLRSTPFEFTCSTGRRWKNPYNQKTYHVPDQVAMIGVLPVKTETTSMEIYSSMDSLKKSFEVHAGLELSKLKKIGAFSLSGGYQESKDTLLKKDITEIKVGL